MTEEQDKKPDETQEEEPEKEKEEEDPVSDIDRAHVAAERMEAANKKREELLVKEEKLAIHKTLGGKAQAGQAQEKPKEETDREYSDRLIRGDLTDAEREERAKN